MKNNYKIAVIAACPFPYPRGTPIRILRMAEGLAARGHEVHVITYHLGQHIADLPFQIHRIPNVPTYHKVTPGPTYQKIAILDSLLSAKIFRVVQNGQFDIIHAHHFEGLLASLPPARLLKIPLVFDVHTLLSTELQSYAMGIPVNMLERIGDFIDHWLPTHADHIVAVTNSIRKRLINEINISPHKVTTVYGGVESDHFNSDVVSESILQKKTVSISKTLIYTGNLASYQGIDLMLHAFRKVLNHRPDTLLKIVTGFSIQPYADLISRLGIQKNLIIENSDYFQLPRQLHSACIALNPRIECDGLPLKLLNYMATGRAIVSFEGSAEVLENEVTGLIVPNHNIDSFALAILRFLEDPQLAEKLGQNAQSHVQEFFVWKTAIKSLELIYNQLLETRL
ncbi:MAG: glycosyltransferase family 4 protein [Anaerolineales bacterium]|nr:glycosyltransferase family 4 protein [Anaerolineales bacterium]